VRKIVPLDFALQTGSLSVAAHATIRRDLVRATGRRHWFSPAQPPQSPSPSRRPSHAGLVTISAQLPGGNG
jgi:hypothetical protein